MGVLPGDLDIGDGVDVADDFIVMPLQSATQWDGLAHVGYDGRFYNNAPTASMNALNGATRNSIDQTLPGFSGRGVLLDLARFHGREWLDADHGITPAELTAVAQQQGVTVGQGDAVLVRTGWLHKASVEGWDGWHDEEPGLTLDCAEWLYERDVSALATDNWAVELLPTPPGDGVYALHCVLIRDMGMMLGEMWNLDALADDCSADGRWDFLLVAPALRVTGAVGSPVSPIALK
jgi:kynurenine formamidase